MDETSTNRKLLASTIEGYLDPENRPWLFLVDGGVSDNLGLRAFYDVFDLAGDLEYTLKMIDYADVRQILIISVLSMR